MSAETEAATELLIEELAKSNERIAELEKRAEEATPKKLTWADIDGMNGEEIAARYGDRMDEVWAASREEAPKPSDVAGAE